MAAPARRLTLDDYTRIEEASEERHEFYDGEVFAMAGGTRRHALLATNVVVALARSLEGTDCQPYGGDLRVRTPAVGGQSELYTFPDVSVVCGPEELAPPADTLLNPTVLVEVLSPSTEAYDRGAKFELYQRIRSLREYVLVAQDRQAVEVYRRGEDDHWTLFKSGPAAGDVDLPSLGVRLTFEAIYARSGVEARPPRHPRSGEGTTG